MIKSKARISFSFSPCHSIFVSSLPIYLIPYNPRSSGYAHRRKTCEPSSPGAKDEKASRDDDHHHDSREDHHDSRDDHQKPVSDGHRSPVRGSASISLCAHAEVQQRQLLAGCLLPTRKSRIWGYSLLFQVFGGDDFGVTAADELPCFFR